MFYGFQGLISTPWIFIALVWKIDERQFATSFNFDDRNNFTMFDSVMGFEMKSWIDLIDFNVKRSKFHFSFCKIEKLFNVFELF